jgi:hypothetical protein
LKRAFRGDGDQEDGQSMQRSERSCTRPEEKSGEVMWNLGMSSLHEVEPIEETEEQ